MRAERIKNIVLVEDFVGSGDRIKGFWKHMVSKSIKSWASFGWTKIWLICYARLEKGFAAVSRVVPITKERMISVLPSQDKQLTLTPAMNAVAETYGRRVRGKFWAGYSGGGSTLIFQHGCPNNTPVILWANGGGFRAIFPGKGIPPGLQGYFGSLNSIATAEVLWTFRQYKLALSLLEDARLSKASAIQFRLLVALGLASSYGHWDDNKLSAQLMIPAHDVVVLRLQAYDLGAVNKQDHRLTPFATDLLSKLRTPRFAASNAKQHLLATVEGL
ncbi:MAG: hypothetical protein IPO66_12025 [Rhodanobacteraceae bacterium]|nr:hypothetical protein [Rhodanobacteraceae bacterium]